MVVDDTTIQEILNDTSKFTKEEYEVVNTKVVKSEAKYEIKRAERIAQTDPKYLVRRKYLEKYGSLAKDHKELLLNNALEEFNAHKEIMLQCLSIIQSLVQNPNLLTTLEDLINSQWGGGQTLKEKLFDIINNHENKLNEVHTELYNLRNCPIIFFLPELYANDHTALSKLPAYDAPDVRQVTEFRDMTDNNYPLIP